VTQDVMVALVDYQLNVISVNSVQLLVYKTLFNVHAKMDTSTSKLKENVLLKKNALRDNTVTKLPILVRNVVDYVKNAKGQIITNVIPA
jgi:hypothetical protein